MEAPAKTAADATSYALGTQAVNEELACTVPAPAFAVASCAGAVATASSTRATSTRDPWTEARAARVGICVDTCHAYAAGYDLVGDWDGV